MKDRRSNVLNQVMGSCLNLSSWEKQAWKKFRLERDSIIFQASDSNFF